MQAITEVLNKSRYGNSHLQMRQNPIPIAEDSRPYHLAYTGTATSYYRDFHSQSGKIKDYTLSFQSLFDNIHQGKYVL